MVNNENPVIFAKQENDTKGKILLSSEPWKILIVDDEEAVHEQTKRILEDFTFENKGLRFYDAYTGEEARRVLQANKDTAIILLDVVMESDDAGLRIVKYVRTVLKNDLVRIVLRTGQPGQAPEKQVIIDYDINDYKAKTELTVTRLYTTIISALRAYRTLIIIEKNKEGLERIIDSSKDIFKIRSMNQFTEGILIQIVAFLRQCTSSLYVNADGFTARCEKDHFKIIAGTGEFGSREYKSGKKTISTEIKTHLTKAVHEKRSFFTQDAYIAFMETREGYYSRLLYLNGCRELSEIDKNLINIFMSNISVAFDNIYLNDQIIESHQEKINMQRGLLSRLNEVIGLRSKETVSHVNRVADFSALLARKLGMNSETVEMIRLTSPMHDIGKIGISDSILLKPAKLTPGEYDIMKTHAAIGAKMLYDEESPLLKIASVIAGTHHEKWDGSGYPGGIKGTEIPIYGRITAICDVFDALTSNRPYKEPWPTETAIKEIKKGSSVHFDPELVDLFLKNIEGIIGIMRKYSEDS